jgi:phosphoribosylanthranilate isomerase
MLRTRVYAGPVFNLTDARYFASYGADWLGFDFNPDSPAYLSPEQAVEIKGWLHGVRCIGEFGGQDADNIEGMAGFAQLDGILLPADQAHLAERLPDLPLLVQASPEIPDFALATLPAQTEAIVLDLREWPSAEWPEQVARFAEHAPVLVDLAVPAEELLATLEQIDASGIRLRGGAEVQVGMKRFEALDAFMGVLEEED